MVCKSRPEIDIQEAVGLHEFTVVPRSLFAREGTMLHCSCKSALMHILENAGGPSTNTQEITAGFQVAIVDGMAEVQSLDKPEWIKNCRDLVEHFRNRLLVKYNDLQEYHIIFDRYDVPSSLKSSTRVKRQGGHAPIYYRITDSTHIAKVPMKKFLAHSKTKGELPTFLAKNVKDNANARQVVVAWGTECEATHRDVRHLRSTQEEADTKIILHALDASAQGATQLSIYSPDTDVLVLALRRYPDLCSNSCFVTGTGSSRRVINLKSIADALGPTKTAALPAFHALTGADVTGSFSGKPLVGMSLITPALLSCKLLLTSVVWNSQMTAQEVEWNSWFVGCTNQRQTLKLSKPSDGPSLRKIKLSLRGCRQHKLLSIKP